jgi:hypothetical protein
LFFCLINFGGDQKRKKPCQAICKTLSVRRLPPWLRQAADFHGGDQKQKKACNALHCKWFCFPLRFCQQAVNATEKQNPVAFATGPFPVSSG